LILVRVLRINSYQRANYKRRWTVILINARHVNNPLTLGAFLLPFLSRRFTSFLLSVEQDASWGTPSWTQDSHTSAQREPGRGQRWRPGRGHRAAATCLHSQDQGAETEARRGEDLLMHEYQVAQFAL